MLILEPSMVDAETARSEPARANTTNRREQPALVALYSTSGMNSDILLLVAQSNRHEGNALHIAQAASETVGPAGCSNPRLGTAETDCPANE